MRLVVTLEKQVITVTEEQGINTDPANNADAVVLKGQDLDVLPDDPDALSAAVQAMAGPSAGPNGGQIFIDGFTGGPRRRNRFAKFASIKILSTLKTTTSVSVRSRFSRNPARTSCAPAASSTSATRV